MFDDNTVCPQCGGTLQQWQGDLYECIDCADMFDMSIFEDGKDLHDEFDDGDESK